MPTHKILLAGNYSISIASVPLQKMIRLNGFEYPVPKPERVEDEMMYASDQLCYDSMPARPEKLQTGGPNYRERVDAWQATKNYLQGCRMMGAGRYEFQVAFPEEYAAELAQLAGYFEDENLPPLKNAKDWEDRGREIVALLGERGEDHARREFWAGVRWFEATSGGLDPDEIARLVKSIRAASERDAAEPVVSPTSEPPAGEGNGDAGGAGAQPVHTGSGGGKAKRRNRILPRDAGVQP